MTRQKLKLHAASGVAITCYCLHGQHRYSAQADDALNRVSGSQCSLRTPTSARLQIDGIVQGHDDSGQGRRGRRIWSSLAAPADGSRLARENPGGWLTTSLSWPQRTSRASDPKKITLAPLLFEVGASESCGCSKAFFTGPIGTQHCPNTRRTHTEDNIQL